MTVILCLDPELEARVISVLASTRDDALVVRRCADVVEVVAAAKARLARLAIIGTDRDGLDVSLLAELQSYIGLALVPTADSRIDDGAVATLRSHGVVEMLEPQPQELAARIRSANAAAIVDGGATNKARGGSVVCVWGPRGSHGRTTLVRDLAALTDDALVVDADAYAPSLAQFMDLEETSALIAATRTIERGRDLDLDALVDRPRPEFGKIRVLQGMNDAQRWREVSRWAADRLWDACRGAARVSIVDVSGGLDSQADRVDHGALTRSALTHADVIIHVASATPAGLRRLIEHIDLVDRQEARHVVAMTGVRSTSIGSDPLGQIAALFREVKMDDLDWFPIRDDRDRLDAVLLKGVSMPHAFPNCQYTKDVAKLWKSLGGDKLGT